MGYLSVYYATALFGVAVQGLAYPEPRPTDKVVIPFDAQSPRPTNPPAVHELLRRQNSKKTTRTVISAPDNICGYFDGRPGLFTLFDQGSLLVTDTLLAQAHLYHVLELQTHVCSSRPQRECRGFLDVVMTTLAVLRSTVSI